MGHAQTKAQRLAQIETLLLANPKGLTKAELSRRLGVHRSTIGRSVDDLSLLCPVYEEQGRLFLDRDGYLVNARFNLHEALSVLLAARLLTTRFDRKNPHAAGALRKLAQALQRLAPDISEHIERSADVMDGEERREDRAYINALEQLTRAWSQRRQTKVIHRHESSGRTFSYVFCPYFIEPYAIGQSTFVVGYRQPPGALRTFKIERIEDVEQLDDTYEIPDEFDSLRLLSGAWGIWYTEREPVEIALRFSAQVAGRVQESQWHPTEQLEPLADGRLLWRAQVAQPTEMLPWIRGWGSDCEVLLPDGLREELASEAALLFAMYHGGGNEQAGGPPDGRDPGDGSPEESEHLTTTPLTPTEPVAHTPNRLGRWHFFDDHARSVAELAAAFAAFFGAEEAASLLGWWHDAGKLHPTWQAYLHRRHADPNDTQKGPPHAIVGFAALVDESINPLLACSIACHHTGLKNLRAQLPEWAEEVKAERYLQEAATLATSHLLGLTSLQQPSLPSLLSPTNSDKDTKAAAALGLRMLHSCLVDADCLDTEAHFDPDAPPLRRVCDDLAVLWEKLVQDQERFPAPEEGSLNHRRAVMYRDALEAAALEPGFFSLSIPTGGGKTRTSVAFALRHALTHGLRRVIVAIPYTSIIEQNADVYKRIFGHEVVLEHHSNLAQRRGLSDERERRERMMAQNWDVPIVVTTNVQLFESLFAARNSKLRKLHNIARSVIVLDEVQTLPAQLLKPTLNALRYLVEHFGCSVVFCTATQPAFSIETLGDSQRFKPLEGIREIVKQPEEHFQALRRVRYHPPTQDSPKSMDALAEAVMSHQRVLVIFNTVKDAHRLLQELTSRDDVDFADGLFHLSTRLCGSHRRRVLSAVSERLQDPALPCRLISTQVVEAGVDLDFPVVYRAMGPLDGIIQAAGRCNREARADLGHVHVFHFGGLSCPPGVYESARDQASRIMAKEPPVRWDQPDVCQRYFRGLYQLQNPDTHDVCDAEANLRFADSARDYRLIEEPGILVLVRDSSSSTEITAILSDIAFQGAIYGRHWRALQPFLVQLYENAFVRAQQDGYIQIIHEDLYEWSGGYDELYGLTESISSQLVP